MPSSRFEHLHVDIVEPFPPSRGYTYLFTVIDRFTRWPEAIPMADCTAQTCAQAFLSGWIARFGVPASVTSDRGRQFISELGRDVLHLFGIKLLKPHRTIHKLMVWLRECITNLRQASKQGSTAAWCTQTPHRPLGHAYCPQGRSWYFSCRTGLWHYTSSPWGLHSSGTTGDITRFLC